MCRRVAESLGTLRTTRSLFIDNPLFLSDLHQLLTICNNWMISCVIIEQPASIPSLSNDLLNLWNITDLLFNNYLTFSVPQLGVDFSRFHFANSL